MSGEDWYFERMFDSYFGEDGEDGDEDGDGEDIGSASERLLRIADELDERLVRKAEKRWLGK
jgi:hypothetical protein